MSKRSTSARPLNRRPWRCNAHASSPAAVWRATATTRTAGAGAGEALTLIASEALEGLEADTGIRLSAADSRRQVLTRGIDLNMLVGREFTVGAVRCRGVELCEPCAHLQSVTQDGVLSGLVHRGGLRADVLSDGEVAVGDAVASVQ